MNIEKAREKRDKISTQIADLKIKMNKLQSIKTELDKEIEEAEASEIYTYMKSLEISVDEAKEIIKAFHSDKGGMYNGD